MNTLLKQLLSIAAGVSAVALGTDADGAMLSLDGVDDYVSVPQVSSLTPGNPPHTIEAWVKPQALPPVRAGLMVFGNVAPGGHHWLLLPSGQVQMGPVNGDASQLNPVIPIGNWTHLAAVSDGTRYSVFTNGSLFGTTTNAAGLFNLQGIPLTLGKPISPGENYFKGAIDEVRIWNTARSGLQILQNLNRRLQGNEAGLVAYYPFSEGAGDTTLDASSRGLGATLSGSPAWNALEEALRIPVAGETTVSVVTDTGAVLRGAANPNGVPGTNRFEWGAGSTALAFDGVDDFVYVENGPDLANRSFSIEFWARRIRSNADEFLFSLGSAGSTRNLLHVGFLARAGIDFPKFSTQMRFGFFADDLNATVNADPFDWHHWAFTYDSATRQRRIYQDGLLVGQNVAGGHFAGAGPLRLGRYLANNAQNAFAGFMDEVRVWKDVTLNEATIRQWMHTEVTNTHPNFTSLEAYWKLNEGLGRTAADSTGHGFTGQFVNNPVWAAGARPVFAQLTSPVATSGANSVLNLDGADDYADAPAGVWFNGGAFTIEGWVFPRSPASWSRLIDFGNGPGLENVMVGISEATSGRPILHVTKAGASQILIAPTPLPLNQWTHLSITHDGVGTARIYVNGVLAAQGSVQAPGNVIRTNNYIGRSNWPADAYANAAFDDVRLWSVARTAQQIRDGMTQPVNPADSSLLLYYRFNEVSGDTVVDSRPVSPRNGTLRNGAGRLSLADGSASLSGLTPGTVLHARLVAGSTNGGSTGRSQRFATPNPGRGTALTFDGVDDYVRVAGFGPQAPTTEVTVEFWQRVHSVREQSAFSLEPDIVGNRMQAHTPWANGIVYWDFGNIDGAGRLSYTPPESLVGQWNHFAFEASQSGNFMRIYRNGVLEAQKTGMDPREAGNFDLILGRYTLNNVSRYFDGELDEFRLWNVARTEADIQRDLNGRLTGNESGLIAYYRMDEGAGLILLDAGPNGLHGLLNSGPAWLPSEAPVGLPVATTQAATDVGFGNATLNGSVNGDGSLPTIAWFEYGTEVALVPGSAENQVSFYAAPSTVSSLSQINFNATPVSVQSFTQIDVASTLGSFWPGGPVDYFAARFTGRLYVPESGTWTFYTVSDDGTQVYLNGQLVVDNDGAHGVQERSGSLYLSAGHYSLDVRYFEKTSPATVSLLYSGPTIPKQIIPAEAFLRHDPAYTTRTVVETLPANAVPVRFTAALANLHGNTTYHYRLVATNANGVSQGADQTFVMLHPAALTALNFDGINDQVIVNSAAALAGLDVTTNATWEAWINPTGPGSDPTEGGVILSKEGEYEIARFADGSIRYAIDITTAQGTWIWIDTGFDAPLNQWTHLALTYDGSLLRFYANGTLVHTNARTAGPVAIGDVTPTMNEFRIGGRQALARFFNGMIDEVRVWNIVRTPAEIQQYLGRTLAGTEPGLLAYYRFDEGNGVVILDSGPRGFHGNLSGGPVGPPTYVASGARLFQPQVTTLPATPVLATTAGLRGAVNPSGTNTVAYFEYGETIAYDKETSPRQVVGSSITTLPLSAMLTNLQPGTLYHYRAVALNDKWPVFGADQTFNTLVLGCGWPISSTVNNGKASSPKHVVDAEGNAYVAGLFSGSATFKTTLQPQGGSATNAFVGKLARGADWLWATNVPISASGALSINALAIDGARNVCVAGSFTGTATFGTNVLSSAGTGSDLFVAKLNSAGTSWLWARATGDANQPDSANALGVSASGAVFVAGHFRGTAAFGSNSLSSANGSQDIFVAKLDTDGRWLWARAAGGAGTNDTALALALNGTDDVYLGGSFQGTGASFGSTNLNASGGVNDTDLFVARLNSAGTWLLARRGGGNGADTATALTIDAAGQVYLLGQFGGTADYNDTVENLNTGGDTRLFVTKLNSSGNMLWYAQAGAGLADSIAVDGTGHVYISGEFTVATEFGDPPALQLVSSGNSDVFLAQLDADSGSWTWSKKIGASGSETRGSIGVDGEGGVVVSGSYQSTIQIGYVLLSSPNERDIFIARLSPDQVFEHNTFVIGQPIPVPVEAQDPSRTDGGAYRQPAITILEKQHQDSDAFNSFVWSLAEQKLFAVRPVTAVFKWPLTADVTNTTRVATCVGRSVWPAAPQVHVANAPVELEPAAAGFRLRYLNLAFATANGAVDAGTKTFIAPTNGWTVLQFLDTGGALPDPSIHPSVFEVVRSILWNDPAYLVDNQPATIGEALTRATHNDPTGKNGHVYFERAFYDGVGNERAYDHATRTGPILPVNRDTAAPDDDLVVIWYRVSPITGIAWPDDPVRYLAHWPLSPDELVLASGAGSGVLDPATYPGKRVYNQPDPSLPGYNPNEEHAALYGDVLYALRNDLNAVINVSEPYTLLKYRNPANNQWAIKVFRVVSTNTTFQFTYTGEAGQQLLMPAPLSLLPLCGASNRWVAGPGYKDHTGRLYARAAGPNHAGTTIVTRYWYPLQPQFFYDLDRDGQPDAAPGDCVPWLDQRPGGVIGTPVDVTYNINWPTTVPTLQIGETLLGAKFGLPDLRHFAQAQVIFDEGDPAGTNLTESLVRLFDPLAPRTIQLRPNGATNFITGAGYDVFRVEGVDSLFADLATANDLDALVFSDLPYVLRARLRYDPLNKNLTFRGLLDESQRYGGPENPLLLPNVLSPRERDRLKDLSANMTFEHLINALYDLTRNPNRLDLDGNGTPDTTLLVGLEQNEDGDIVPEDLGDGPKILTAGTAQNSGFVTVVENDDPSLSGLPVNLHIIRVEDGPFRGDIKVLQSDNVFDEKLTLRHSADFGGAPQNFEFEWYYKPVGEGVDPSDFPTLLPTGDIADQRGWTKFAAIPSDGFGVNDITLGDGGASSLLVLADNYFVCRYRGYVINGETNWSDWVGIIGGGQAQLAEGWVKRVRGGLNPFKARSAAFHESETVTFASMLQQAGTRYEGDIAFNPGGGNINSIGLIEAYETVLRRAKRLSIEGSPAINYQPANDALLLAAGFIADLYMLLGNEAFADAADPTIGFRTDSAGYGTLAPSIFAFQNQVDSLLEEELCLLRGRDDRSATVRLPPVYNRLFWNFTRDEGEVAYAQAYNITDQNGDGFIDASDARIMYPQAHGDAWGHYLTATKTYYALLQNPNFEWVPRSEPILLSGVPMNVDYLDERKFARAAAAKAKTGAEIVDLTYRLNFVDDPAGQYQGYKDTDSARAWGVSEWAQRAGAAAFFDWVTANGILPSTDPNTNHTGIAKIDRSTVPELDEIVSAYESVQSQMDKADSGLNPLGLAKDVVPFDIDPSLISAGKTHFEQIYDRAIQAMNNTVAVFDHANQLSQALRGLQDTVNNFSKNVADQERDYKNRLIEIFGYPYAGDIGPGKTYPSGYDGPDLYHYMYVNTIELNGDTAPPSQTFTAFFKPGKFGLTNTLSTDAGVVGKPNYEFFFPGDAGADPGSRLETDILQVSNPMSAGDFGFVAPAIWGQRRAPGELQMTLSSLLQDQARLKQAVINYDNLIKQIEDTRDLLQARYNLAATELQIKNQFTQRKVALTAVIVAAKIASKIAKSVMDTLVQLNEIAMESFPKVVGTANDVTSVARGTVKATLYSGTKGLTAVAVGGEVAQEVATGAIEAAKGAADAKIETARFEYEIRQKVAELEALVREEAPRRLDVIEMSEVMSKTAGEYSAKLAAGIRLIDERRNLRETAAADTQQRRYQDMTFRIFRNDAIQKYRAQFDLAAQYVFLAAVAYDFETQLLGGRAGAGREFLTDIVRQRALGEIINGVPIAGRHGLADPLARLSQNFGVLKGQLGFNNPQTETGRFSLRNELLRMRDNSDASWRAELKKSVLPNLWNVPEFRRYCRPFAPESAGPQPGLVIRFPTTVTFGLNYFGWPLGGGDNAYDPTLFATKVRSAGVWFENYNGNGLSQTPRVYLVPVGADVLRSPSGNDLETREWRVVDQKIPVPFPIGFSSLKNPSWIPMNDSLSDTFADIRRFSSFRAYHDRGTFNPAETVTDSRLIGRSVWNTDWMLIIPGGTFLFDPNQGLDTFISSVSDIKIFFQTYAYSGN